MKADDRTKWPVYYPFSGGIFEMTVVCKKCILFIKTIIIEVLQIIVQFYFNAATID